MILRGTKKRDRRKLADAIESRGGSLSAYGGKNSLGIKLKILSHDFDLGMDVMADVVRNPQFPQEEVEKIRQDILAALTQEDKDLFSMGSFLLNEQLFNGHPYRFRSLGSPPVIQDISRDALKKLYTRLFVPENMVITVYGDVEYGHVLEAVQKYFGDWKGTLDTIPTSQARWPQTIIRKKHAMDKEQTLLLVGFPGLSLTNKDRYVCEVLNTILTGQGGRLFERIRGAEGLAYSVGSYYSLGLDPGSIVFYVFTVPESVDIAHEKILEEIQEIKDGTITPEDLEMAQNKLIGDDLRGRQSLSVRAFDAALNELYGLGYDYNDQYASYIQAVTLEDVVAFAEKYFTENQYVRIQVGNLDGIE